MTIQVTCPNASCAKVLSVQETYAGKKGMCPACGSVLMIPAAPRSEGGAGQRTPEPRGRIEDNEPARVPAAGATVRPIDDDYAYDTRREGARSHVTNKPAAGAMTRFALSIGIAALCLLAFSPRMHWIYVAKKDDGFKVTRELPERADLEETLAQMNLNEAISGMELFFGSLVIAGLAIVALACTPTQMRDLADGAIAASGSAAVGWGVLGGIWQLGLVWKVMTFSSTLRSSLWNPSRQYFSSIYPGTGLGIGLIAAFVTVLVFGALASSRGRFLWAFTAAMFGFIIGMLILVVSVKPWVQAY